MSKPKGKRKTVFRDSVNGQFITEAEAKRRPRTTERERVLVRAPKKRK